MKFIRVHNLKYQPIKYSRCAQKLTGSQHSVLHDNMEHLQLCTLWYKIHKTHKPLIAHIYCLTCLNCEAKIQLHTTSMPDCCSYVPGQSLWSHCDGTFLLPAHANMPITGKVNSGTDVCMRNFLGPLRVWAPKILKRNFSGSLWFCKLANGKFSA